MPCPVCYCSLVCGCGCVTPTREVIEPLPRDQRNVVYILLLGAAETGKSTLMRQMRIIHSGGMSSASLRSYKRHVLNNLFVCVSQLVKAASSASLLWSSTETVQAAHTLANLSLTEWGLEEEQSRSREPQIPLEHAQLIALIWQDGTAQQCWQRANEFNLPDSTAYYLSAAARLAEEHYLPTQEDVLRLRLPSRSATVYEFTDKSWTFQITDVGGQRGERRRWIRLFDGLHAIIFLAALSEYDQVWSEEEEGGINRLQLSLRLFKETLGYSGFIKTSIILFLNKTDIFQQKVATSHLSRYFPDYVGPRSDARSATNFIRGMFLENAKRNNVYSHETCATDTEQTRFVFAAVRDDILWKNVREIVEPFE